MTYNNLPLFEACIDTKDSETGMFVISLVDSPANERDFVAFEEVKQIQTYSIANDEEQKVFGLVMECDKPIYRRNQQGFKYYITYNRKTIEAMTEKYFKMGLQNNVDTMHNFELEDGITLTQMFIKDSEKGVNPIGFEDVNDGSLFAEFHIENAEVWNAIKEGEYKGFSLAGVFIQKEVEHIEETYNKKQNKLQMKVNKVKEMLRKLLATFGEVATDKGTILWDFYEDLKDGFAVHTVDAEGNEIALEDGEYQTEDKKIITVQDGKVISIVDVQAEVDDNEGKNVETAEEPEGAEGKTGEDAPKETEPTEIQKIREEIDELYKLVDSILEKIGESRREADERFKKLEEMPMAKSAEEAFENLSKGNTEADKMKARGYRW